MRDVLVHYPFGYIGLGLTLWGALFFSREWALRTALLVSVLLHGTLFVGWGGGACPRAEARDRGDVMAFTLVQGVDEEGEGGNVALLDLSMLPPGPRVRDRATPPISVGEVAVEAPGPTREEPAMRIEPALPRIEHLEPVWFVEHPKGESYRLRVRRLIQQHLDVPRELVERGYEGRQKVWLTVRRDGRLLSCYIDEQFRSENELVNETSLQGVRASAREFPPLPEGVRDYDVLFYVILDYKNLGRE